MADGGTALKACGICCCTCFGLQVVFGFIIGILYGTSGITTINENDPVILAAGIVAIIVAIVISVLWYKKQSEGVYNF